MLTQTIALAIGVTAVVALFLWLEGPRRRALAVYWARPCQGRRWRKKYPDASAGEIRAFLSLVAQSFAFGDRRRLSFNPDDSVLDIYTARNPRPGWPDAFELETLCDQLRTSYSIDLQAIWRADLTLGEIFERTHAA